MGVQSRLPNLLDVNETLRALANATLVEPKLLRRLAVEAERCCLEFFAAAKAQRRRSWQRRLASVFWRR